MDWVDVVKDWVWLASAMSPFVAGAVLLWLRSQFATKAEHQEALTAVSKGLADIRTHVDQRRSDTDERLTRLEVATEGLPTRKDLEQVGDRLAGVERASAVTAEAVRGTERMMGRVEHTMNLLLQQKLNEERAR
ncbi:DUF2730 family protein [Pararhodobacter sp.]|uniref:DUF2730 family protein n=1 Tax=Pararhodobacter sp. TaxID=2127056 RepID=UPI002AFE976B|nr:DUF2730 family protein [Pararhodobacter sp.]